MKKSLMLPILFILISLTGFISADIGDSGCGMMGGMMYGTYGGTGMLFGWIFYLSVIVLIIAAIYWLIKSANRRK